MTRIEALRKRLQSAGTRSLGKPTIAELEEAMNEPNSEVDLAPSGEVIVRASISLAPQDARDLLDLYDAVKCDGMHGAWTTDVLSRLAAEVEP